MIYCRPVCLSISLSPPLSISFSLSLFIVFVFRSRYATCKILDGHLNNTGVQFSSIVVLLFPFLPTLLSNSPPFSHRFGTQLSVILRLPPTAPHNKNSRHPPPLSANGNSHGDHVISLHHHPPPSLLSSFHTSLHTSAPRKYVRHNHRRLHTGHSVPIATPKSTTAYSTSPALEALTSDIDLHSVLALLGLLPADSEVEHEDHAVYNAAAPSWSTIHRFSGPRSSSHCR